MQKLHCFSIHLAVFALGCCGCGSEGSSVPTANVSGTVYLDGKPAGNVDVTFISDTYKAEARTDAQGHFELSSPAAIGENKVFFSKLDRPGPAAAALATGAPPDAMDAMDQGQLVAMQHPGMQAPSRGAPRQLIPAHFSDPAATTVRFTVPEDGSTDAAFQLQTR